MRSKIILATAMLAGLCAFDISASTAEAGPFGLFRPYYNNYAPAYAAPYGSYSAYAPVYVAPSYSSYYDPYSGYSAYSSAYVAPSYSTYAPAYVAPSYGSYYSGYTPYYSGRVYRGYRGW